MSATDNPLKLLILSDTEGFATWLLGRKVTDVEPINVEFPARGARSDLLLRVNDPPNILLHIEMQGGTSHAPMPLRELDYLSRIVWRDIGVPTQKTPHLHSVVIYLGANAGKNDKGEYEVRGLNEQAFTKVE